MPKDPYNCPHAFADYSEALDAVGCHRPVLLLDRDALQHNLTQLLRITERGFALRWVVKSLPSIALLRYVLDHDISHQGQRLMCFHLPFIPALLEAFPAADIMLGKPMPIGLLANLERSLHAHKLSQSAAHAQIQWLIDTPQRLIEYEIFARQKDLRLRICLELDVGLRRGGFAPGAELQAVLEKIEMSPVLQLSGLMGYEAHTAKLPLWLGGQREQRRVAERYSACLHQVATTCRVTPRDLYLNLGGSLTCNQYGDRDKDYCNELAVGSALLKPKDFNHASLAAYRSACFIAAPVLKHVQPVRLPGPDWLSALLRLLRILPPRAGFIYGGQWLADPVFPAAARAVRLFGRSSNQEMYGLPDSDDPDGKPDAPQRLYFWPRQSEALLRQMGPLALIADNRVEAWWPVLTEGKDWDAPVLTTGAQLECTE